jgi:hypothetical protein
VERVAVLLAQCLPGGRERGEVVALAGEQAPRPAVLGQNVASTTKAAGPIAADGTRRVWFWPLSPDQPMGSRRSFSIRVDLQLE